MILYDYPRAPNPMRVNLFINEKKIKIDRVNVDLSKHQNLKPRFLKLNPWGTVPFLKVNNTIIVSNAEPNSTAVVKAGSSTINVPINSSGNGSVPRGNIPAGSTLTVEDTSSTCEAEITEGYEVVPDDVDLRAGKGSVDVDEVSYKFIYSGCRPNDQIKVTVTTPAPSANTSTKIIKIVK